MTRTPPQFGKKNGVFCRIGFQNAGEFPPGVSSFRTNRSRKSPSPPILPLAVPNGWYYFEILRKILSPGTTWTWGENFRDFEIGAFKVLQTWTILLVGRVRGKNQGTGGLARYDARKQSRAGAGTIAEGPPMTRLNDPAALVRRPSFSWTLVGAFALALAPAATAERCGRWRRVSRVRPRPRRGPPRRRRAPAVARRLDGTPDGDPPTPGPRHSGRSPTRRPRSIPRTHRHARPRRLPRREGDVPDPARGPDDREPLPAEVARPAPGDPGRPRPLARGEAGPGRAGPLHRGGEARVRRPRGRRLRRRRAGRRQGARRVPRRDDRRDPLAHRPDPRRPPGLRERPRPRLPRHPARGRRRPRRGHRRQRRGQPDDVRRRDDRRPEGGRPRLLGGQLPGLPGDRLLHVRARPRGPDVHRGVGCPRPRRARGP